MSISQESLVRKMKEEIAQAEANMHTDQFEVSIGKLQVLCELLLDQPKESSQARHTSVKRGIEAIYAQKESPRQEQTEELEGDSIFDF